MATVTRASPVAAALLIVGPGTSTRNIWTSPLPRSSSSKTSLSCARAGTSAWKRSIAVAISSWVEGISPRYCVAVAKEASRGTVLWESSQPDCGVGPLLDGTPRRCATHVRPDPARAHRVHLDPALVRGERAGQGVERRLRDAIRRSPPIHVRELSRAARDVDDARCLARSQQRQERLDQPPGAKGVDLENLVCALEVVLRGSARIAVDPGVVHEGVETPGLALDPLTGREDGVLIG